jgi:hypothetical protein
MNKNTKKWQEASREAHRTARWAKTMTKWLISRKRKGGVKWHVVNFAGLHNSESRGIVDLLAIRKDHRTHDEKIKRGDSFEIIWKPKKKLQLYMLKQNRWIEIKPNEIF